MGFLKRNGRAAGAAPAPDLPVQIRQGDRHPFSAIGNYVPLKTGEIRLYRAIREAVPIVDAAILKLIRLTGGFSVECPSERVGKELNCFLKNVNVGRGQRGIEAFLSSYLDSLITCGRAVGEVVVTPGAGDIAAVLCGNVSDIEIKEGGSPLDFTVCGVRNGAFPEPLPYQELILFTPFNPEADEPYGVSILRSMPFLTEILLKIYSAIGSNWERMGNVRFAVTYKPHSDSLDRAAAAERGAQIAKEWSNAMQAGKSGGVRDFVAVGDVEIKAIGADNQILDSEVPVRQILEQLIARTGIPPFMLGLSWSTTERMSSQQADLMTSEIWAIRRTVTPMLTRICELWLRIHGYTDTPEIVWEDVNLQDEVEEAKARLYTAQALKIEKELEGEV